jgi:hypothetical protein
VLGTAGTPPALTYFFDLPLRLLLQITNSSAGTDLTQGGVPADEVFQPLLPKHLSELVAVPSCLQRVTLCEKDYLERLALVQS